MPPYTCYITGAKEIQSYNLSPIFKAYLTQEAYAYYILRAKKDATHQGIELQGQKIAEDIRQFKEENIIAPYDNQEGYISAQVAAIKLDRDRENYYYDASMSSLRILDEMKKDYQASEKLS